MFTSSAHEHWLVSLVVTLRVWRVAWPSGHLSRPDTECFVSPVQCLKTQPQACQRWNTCSNHPGKNVVANFFLSFFIQDLSPQESEPYTQCTLMIRVCDQSHDSYRAAITCGTVCCALQYGFTLTRSHSNESYFKLHRPAYIVHVALGFSL